VIQSVSLHRLTDSRFMVMFLQLNISSWQASKWHYTDSKLWSLYWRANRSYAILKFSQRMRKLFALDRNKLRPQKIQQMFTVWFTTQGIFSKVEKNISCSSETYVPLAIFWNMFCHTNWLPIVMQPTQSSNCI
jgi:hypothetical protein